MASKQRLFLCIESMAIRINLFKIAYGNYKIAMEIMEISKFSGLICFVLFIVTVLSVGL